MEPAGLVVIAMAGLWIAYLVPQRLRYRQQLLECRTDDRFSDGLRVLRVAQPAVRRTWVGRRTGRGTAGAGPAVAQQARVQLHASTRRARRERDGGGPMDRPHATRDRISADAARASAAEHAQRAANLARRRAGARRRAALTGALLLIVAGGWSAVGLVSASVLLGAVPTVLLAGVLALGRRAVVAGARADAEWEAGAATRLPAPTRASRTPGVVGRAVRPSDASTEVMARITAPADDGSAGVPSGAAPAVHDTSEDGRVAGDSAQAGPAGADGAQRAADHESAGHGEEPSASTWAPVPVPRPSYTLKPSARRPEPAPLDLEQEARVAAAAASAVDDGDRATPEPSAAPETRVSLGATDGGQAGLDLDAILARRRASGE